MLNGGFSSVQVSGCLDTDADAIWRGASKHPPQPHSNQRQCGPAQFEPRDLPRYDASVGDDSSRRTYLDVDTSNRTYEAQHSHMKGAAAWNVNRYHEESEREDPRIAGCLNKNQQYEETRRSSGARYVGPPAVQLRVAHLEPISIRPKSKNPQIVNVCQTFRFPDNIITQNNATKMAQHQEQQPLHQQLEEGPITECRQLPYNVNLSRSGMGGFFGINRHRRRNICSQTSRTLLELLEVEQEAQHRVPQHQNQQRPITVPRTLYQPKPRMPHDVPLLPRSASESTIDDPRINNMRKVMEDRREYPRPGNCRPRTEVRYFARSKVGGQFVRSQGRQPEFGGSGKQGKHLAGKVKDDHRKLQLYDGSEDSPFVGDPLVSITGRCRQKYASGKQALDEEIEFGEESEDSDADDLNDHEEEEEDQAVCTDLDEPEDEEEGDEGEGGRIAGAGRQRPANRSSRGTSSVKEGQVGIAGIVDKMQDNVWETCLEGIWDLMDMAGRIDWKMQEKYITVINRKLIEFLKSPRTALCRSACQVSGEMFREAKSTKRPEFDEIVDILLCKTADPNRFIQKDANVALDKLVTYIPTPHTVRALSIRGTIHRNPLVRTATARLLVCVCVVAGLDAILGMTANTRMRKTILSMLAKILTDKNQETRKFGERLYRMLRKHKFFDEYFYKDMDNNLRTNLKRVLKGL